MEDTGSRYPLSCVAHCMLVFLLIGLEHDLDSEKRWVGFVYMETVGQMRWRLLRERVPHVLKLFGVFLGISSGHILI